MATTSTDEESYVLESVLLGYHTCKVEWTPISGKMLQVHCEDGNTYNRYIIATSRDGSVVGHLPIKYARVLLQHCGSILCEITGGPLYCWKA